MPHAPPTHKPAGTRIKVAHKLKASAEWYDRELKTGRWQKFRDVFLDAYPLCAVCGSPGDPLRKIRLEVHHVIPRSERPDLMYEEDNCRTMCTTCHSKVTRAEDSQNREVPIIGTRGAGSKSEGS